jgi:hypothetical protein
MKLCTRPTRGDGEIEFEFPNDRDSKIWDKRKAPKER